MRDIKVLHLEPTDVCQAACPLCSRETDSNFNKKQQHHLTMDQILQAVSVDQILRLNKMFMCGNYGDPAAGQYTLNICQEFRKINPAIVLGMNSNGAIRDETWWHNLGTIFNQPKDYVVFSIDGLEDTNHIYRINVNWHKLMKNVQAFIAAGGSAHWDMLVYRHNQHQVDQCQQLAKEMGFTWFRAKVSKRPFIKNLQFPIGWESSTNISPSIIDCHILREQSLYIDAQGRVSPCCWLGDRQQDFVSNFDLIQSSWQSNTPNPICVNICSTNSQGSCFTNQWRREVKL